LEYAFTRYESKALVSQDEVYEEVPLPYHWGESVELVATKDVSAVVDDSSEVERRVTTEELPPSASAGEELGKVEVLVNGQSVGSSPLVAKEGYEEAFLWDRAWYAVEGLAQRVWAWLLGYSSLRAATGMTRFGDESLDIKFSRFSTTPRSCHADGV